jgi:hypothetical protein
VGSGGGRGLGGRGELAQRQERHRAVGLDRAELGDPPERGQLGGRRRQRRQRGAVKASLGQGRGLVLLGDRGGVTVAAGPGGGGGGPVVLGGGRQVVVGLGGHAAEDQRAPTHRRGRRG